MSLLSDDERLGDARKSRAAMRDKMQSSNSSRRAARAVSTDGRGEMVASTQEQRELERAIEESKRTAAEHERRLKEREHDERQLQRAIEQTRSEQARASFSQSQAPPPSKSSSQQQQQQQQQQQLVDLWGSTTTDQRKQDLDFFGSIAASGAVQQNEPDPFGFSSAGAGSTAMVSAGSNFLGPTQQQTANPFGAVQTYQAQQYSAASTSFATTNNAFAPNPVFQQQTSAYGSQPPYAVQQGQHAAPPMQQNAAMFGGTGAATAPTITNTSTTAAPFQTSFDSAFDTGAGQKNFVPRHLQGHANPNAQLAQIARNASQIDPFAGLANTGNTSTSAATGMKPNGSMSNLSGFLGSGNGNVSSSATIPWSSVTTGTAASSTTPNYSGNFGTSTNPFGAAPVNTAPSTSGPDPFASLVPLSKNNLAMTPVPPRSFQAQPFYGQPIVPQSQQISGQQGMIMGQMSGPQGQVQQNFGSFGAPNAFMQPQPPQHPSSQQQPQPQNSFFF